MLADEEFLIRPVGRPRKRKPATIKTSGLGKKNRLIEFAERSDENE